MHTICIYQNLPTKVKYMQTCNINVRKKLSLPLFFALYAMHVWTVSLHAMFRCAQQTNKLTRDDIKKDLAWMFFDSIDIENGSWVSKPCRTQSTFPTSFAGYSLKYIQYVATIATEQSLALQPSKENIKNLQQQERDLSAKIALLQKIAGLGSCYFVQKPTLKKSKISSNAMLDQMAHHITNIQPINAPKDVNLNYDSVVYRFSYDPEYMHASKQKKQADMTRAHDNKYFTELIKFYKPLKEEREIIVPDASSQSAQDHPLKKPIFSNFNTLRRQVKKEVVLSDQIAQLKKHEHMWQEKAVVHTLATTVFITSITGLCATYLLSKK